MPNRLSGVTIDCVDPARLAAFWSALLDRPVTDEHDGPDWATVGSRRDVLPRLTFQRVDEPKRGKVRLHLDVQVDDIDAGRAQVESLGGRWTGERHDYDEGVVIVMADLEDNEFCLVEYFPTAPAVVTLRPMTDTEFDRWRAGIVATYAEDKARARGGDFTLAESSAEFDRLLPDGRRTTDHHLLTAVDADGVAAGSLWLAPHPEIPNAAYVFDVEIDGGQRGSGLGRATMLAAEAYVRTAGCTALGLNVFGFNASARGLYDSLGYRVIGTNMLKRFD